MDIYPALLLFTFIIIIYWVIIELFTFFFHFTGLTTDRARFQVISLLTGTGFTTRESELILSSRHRRQLARITMLFGYVFKSMKLSQVSHQFVGFLIPLGTAALIFVLMRVPKIRAWIDSFLLRLADRIFDRRESFNAVLLVDNIGTESIARVKLRHIPEEYKGLTLAETRLRAETGIMVMLVERNGEKPAAAHANTVFEEGDSLTVFGNYNMICKSFHARQHFADE